MSDLRNAALPARAESDQHTRLKAKRYLSWLGSMLVILSFGFIGHRLWSQGIALEGLQLDARLLWSSTGAALVYALACFFLSNAWHALVSLFSEFAPDRGDNTWVYAKSQLGKYIPGNFMHLAGRHLLSRDLGLSHATLAASALGEIAGLLAASSTLAALGLGLLGIQQQLVSLPWLLLAVPIGLLLAVAAGRALWPMARRRLPGLPRLEAPAAWRGLLGVYLRYLCFFAGAGAALLWLIHGLGGAADLQTTAAVMVVFAASWLAGFVTPGAPSGIGVREAIIVLALEQMALAVPPLSLALLFRLVTVSGDVLFFAIAAIAHRRRRCQPDPQ